MENKVSEGFLGLNPQIFSLRKPLHQYPSNPQRYSAISLCRARDQVEQIVERSVYSLLDNQYKFDLGIEHFSAVFMIGFGGETELRQTLKGDIESSHDLAEKLNYDKHGKALNRVTIWETQLQQTLKGH